MKKQWETKVLFMAGLLLALSANADYSGQANVRAFIDRMVAEHDFDQAGLNALFTQVEKKQAIIDAMNRPAEKTKTWAEYRAIFLRNNRIEGGADFWRDNAEALARAEQTYGVPAEYIVAIIGVETLYGKITGNYRVMDALSTLAFDYPRRADFFVRELEQYLLLTREHQQDPLAHTGSYAGAMGFGQFMPSSYRHYAVDFDGDSVPDIWNNATDAIGSVANYFARHGWQPGAQVVMRARPAMGFTHKELNSLNKPLRSIDAWQNLGLAPIESVDWSQPAMAVELEGEDGLEYWLGFNNFYVITRYNRSPMYALAVHQLAQALFARHQAENDR